MSTAPQPAAVAWAETLRVATRMPKVVLHDHLDGGLREATLLELLRLRGITPPAPDVPGLQHWLDQRAHAGSLEEYLKGFALTVAAMASPQALRRVAAEAAEDALADGCVLAEFRIAPLLFEAHGISGDDTVRALLDGLRDSALPSGLIVCAMRDQGQDTVQRSADLAIRWAGSGVVGFDLAGPEAGWPALPFAHMLRRVREAGLGLTLHAGEADAGERVLEAVRLGATRIGHGVRLVDSLGTPKGDAARDELRAQSVHLEICPTSNVQTGAAPSVAQHPIRALWTAGLSLSFHTDNRLISRTTASAEAAALVSQAGFDWEDLRRMGLAAARASFLTDAQRQRAVDTLHRWPGVPQAGLGPAHAGGPLPP